MSKQIKVLVETYDDHGNIEKSHILFDDKISTPTNAEGVGLSQLQQLNILQHLQDDVIRCQVSDINQYDVCPLCGEKIRKNGFERSGFDRVWPIAVNQFLQNVIND